MQDKIKVLFEGTKYISHQIEGDVLTIVIESTQEYNTCPYCGRVSDKVHSYRIRKFNDLPIEGYKVNAHLRCKKFFCINDKCDHKTFSEIFTFIKPLEMKTNRLIEKILEIFAYNSSRKATILLQEIGINTCKATVCNLRNKQ